MNGDGVVYALRHFAVRPGELIRLDGRADRADLMRLMHCAHLRDHAIQAVNAGVEIVLDRVEIAVIVFGDPGRNIAFADALDVLRRDI